MKTLTLTILALSLTACTTIKLPNGIEYTNVLQNKAYEVQYVDPVSRETLSVRINVSNDPAIEAIRLADKIIGAVPAPVPVQ